MPPEHEKNGEFVRILDDAAAGLSLGFLPYQIQQALAKFAEAETSYVSDLLPDINLLFGRVEGHLRCLPVVTKGAIRGDALGILRSVAEVVRGAGFRSDVDQARRSANRDAATQACSHSWKSTNKYLQAFLAISPDVKRDACEKWFDEARERQWAGSSRDPGAAHRVDAPKRKKASGTADFDKIIAEAIAALNGTDAAAGRRKTPARSSVPECASALAFPMLPIQWNIATCIAGIAPRQEASCVLLFDRVRERVNALAKEMSDVFRDWLRIGTLLGEAYWVSWCPVPEKFHDYLPRALRVFASCPESGGLTFDHMKEAWERRCKRLAGIQRAREAFGGHPPGPQRNSRRLGNPEAPAYASPTLPWQGYLAHWCMRRFQLLCGSLENFRQSVDESDEYLRFKRVPPLLIINDHAVIMCRILGDPLSVTTLKVLRCLAAKYPEGASQADLAEACDLRRAAPSDGTEAKYLKRSAKEHPVLEKVLRFPVVRGQGGYRLRWPS